MTNKLANPVIAILAQTNPTLLEMNMAADLTAQKIDQLRQSQELPGHAYGHLFYVANDVQRERASGRVFGMWEHLQKFWESYGVYSAPPAAKSNWYSGELPSAQPIVIDSLSQMSEAMAHATAQQAAKKARKPTKTRKARAS